MEKGYDFLVVKTNKLNKKTINPNFLPKERSKEAKTRK